MKKVLLRLTIYILLASALFSVFTPAPTYAANCDDDAKFLTFNAWYRGLCDGSNGIKSPDPGPDGIRDFVWTIVLNILSILFNLVGYLAVGFILYGGYLYVLARGAPENIAKAKKVITNAIIGLIIAILSTVIVNTIVARLVA